MQIRKAFSFRQVIKNLYILFRVLFAVVYSKSDYRFTERSIITRTGSSKFSSHPVMQNITASKAKAKIIFFKAITLFRFCSF